MMLKTQNTKSYRPTQGDKMYHYVQQMASCT